MGEATAIEATRDLKLEILRLETKLRDLHASDKVADKRALVALQQHVQALYQESKGISENISNLDVDPFNQKLLEEELGAISVAALTTYMADRLIAASKLLESKEVRGVVWTLSATYVAWRITFRFWRNLGKRIQKNVNCKSDLECSYSKVAERIDVMHQLVENKVHDFA